MDDRSVYQRVYLLRPEPYPFPLQTLYYLTQVGTRAHQYCNALIFSVDAFYYLRNPCGLRCVVPFPEQPDINGCPGQGRMHRFERGITYRSEEHTSELQS